MPKDALTNPGNRTQECAELEKRFMEIVEQTRDLFQKIDEMGEFLHDCKLKDVGSSTVNDLKDWLALAKAKFQLFREQFHHLLGILPDDVKKRVGAQLKYQELTELFAEEDEEDENLDK